MQINWAAAASLEAAAPTTGIPSQRLGTRSSLKACSRLAFTLT
ncbi:MAG: hypothetical protein V7K97_23740 [Nostoc sp.]